MNQADVEYLNLVNRILKEGTVKQDRTGTGTISLFGPQMEFDLSKGFPMLTTKELPVRVINEELFWFINGDTDLKTLLDRKVNIWNPDGYRFYKEQGGTLDFEAFLEMVRKEGFDLGPIYGAQWRGWETEEGPIDQLRDVTDRLRTNPDDRRLIVSAWNPGDIRKMALPPCHILFQYYVENGRLSCKLYQRSADMFLGVPFNIASYAAKTHLMAHTLGLEVGKFIHSFGDAHIYLNHIDQVTEQLKRKPKDLPTIRINAKHDYLDQYKPGDIEIIGYDPHGPIKGAVSVGL